MNPESKRPIEIEDLLRLKRGERPPAEFWAEFDRQLRAKQLAALVGKRPWWRRVPALFTGFSRYHLPLGAAAILAVGFIVFHDRVSSSLGDPSNATPNSQSVVVVAPVSATVAAEAVTSVNAVVADAPSETASERVSNHTIVAAEISTPQASQAPGAAPSPTLSAIGLPLLGVSATEPASDQTAPTAHYLAALLSPSSIPEPVLARSLLATSAFETRMMTRPAIEPLQQMTPPGERAHAKLLTAMVSKPTVESRTRTTDEIGSRLPEDRLYEQVRRFGARGAGLNIKL
jgi:hypothetical protein